MQKPNLLPRAILVTLGLTFLPLIIVLGVPQLAYVPLIGFFVIMLIYIYLSPLFLLGMIMGGHYISSQEFVFKFYNNGLVILIIIWLVILSFVSYFVVKQPPLSLEQKQDSAKKFQRTGKILFGSIILSIVAYGIFLLFALR